MSNILATFDDTFDPNQASLIITSFSPYKVADTCPSICKEKTMQDLVRLNISCILTNVYDENQANNIFHQVLYQTLCSSLQEESVMGEVSSCKL